MCYIVVCRFQWLFVDCEVVDTLQLGLDCATEGNPKHYLNTLIVEIKNAIRHLDIQLQKVTKYIQTLSIQKN